MNDQSPNGNGHENGVIIEVEDDRTGMSATTLERAVLDHLYYTCAKDERSATHLDVYRAMAHATRDRLVQRWIRTARTYYAEDVKRVYYLSAEFLLGRALTNNLVSLGLFELSRKILQRYHLDIEDVLNQEVDPGLGNGGLGRLAACFLDSMATLGIPGYGYGIRYEFGIFKQGFREGWQVEQVDAWARYGNPWEIPRHDYSHVVRFYGRVEGGKEEDGRYRPRWVDTRTVIGVPYDVPVAGYGNDTVNILRLWSARATHDLDLAVFNDGDYRRAVEEKALSESISKVLYPHDQSPEGKELRLKQEYFFVACSLHDIMRRYKKRKQGFENFHEKVAIQLNDTHPAIAVAELMRIFIDQEDMPWEQAWDITRKTLAFTNHTLLPEALEKWPVPMFERLLPRHLQIIFEINQRFMRQVEIFRPGDEAMQRRMSIIEEGKEKQVRMAHLAVVGSHSVNGVAALHSNLVKTQLLSDFYAMWPERFNNKTNGVTPRRWLLSSNPLLAAAITRRLGRGWITNLDELVKLEDLADNASFLQELQSIKLRNKRRLARFLEKTQDIDLDEGSIFDVHVKRLHEYKRQLLNCLHIIASYIRLRKDPSVHYVPRTFIFGGKAAPGYAIAKLHIKLINDVAQVVNNDPIVRDRIKVIFIPNYGVTLAEKIIPAADVSEQISMAGKEASGTGNMKFAMNGALTVGTLDGANVEIRELVGADNFFLFGLNASQVQELRRSGYVPRHYINRSEPLQEVLELIESGFFSPDDPKRFRPVIDSLRNHDPYMVCADFDDYVACQRRVSEAYEDPQAWSQHVVHNLSNVGNFSSDRTIRQYADEIWNVKSVPVSLDLEEDGPPAPAHPAE